MGSWSLRLLLCWLLLPQDHDLGRAFLVSPAILTVPDLNLWYYSDDSLGVLDDHLTLPDPWVLSPWSDPVIP